MESETFRSRQRICRQTEQNEDNNNCFTTVTQDCNFILPFATKSINTRYKIIAKNPLSGENCNNSVSIKYLFQSDELPSGTNPTGSRLYTVTQSSVRFNR